MIIFFQAILRDGGKPDIEEIKVTENAEEHKAKDYANALESMQNALKREKQIKMEKVIHEKNKANVSSANIPIPFELLITTNFGFSILVKRDSLDNCNRKYSEAISWNRAIIKIFRKVGSGKIRRM